MTLLPPRFLIRIAHRCHYQATMPLKKDRVVDLPEAARIQNAADLEGLPNFADLRLAWNEFGLGVQCIVRGKEQPAQGDVDRPRTSDGLSLWLDTRDARTSHRASRTCHQFHFLPAGAGPDRSECAFVQSKINRALADAPIANASDVPFRCERFNDGYRLEAFLPASVLSGFDPAEHPRWGFYYVVRDSERGEEFLSVNGDFPYWDDPSLWASLDLVKGKPSL